MLQATTSYHGGFLLDRALNCVRVGLTPPARRVDAPSSPRSTVLSSRSGGKWAHMPESVTLELPDLAATEAFGRRLAGLLFPGAVVGLVGPLGAGKTHLVRAVAEGLGIADSRAVSSPTFVLIQEYDARLPIYHFDA